MKSSKLLVGILAGFAGGVLAGMLFAPKKGADMRQNIINKSDDYAGTIKNKFSEIIDVISQKHQNVMDDADDMMDEGKSKINLMVAQGKDKYQESKNDANDVFA